MWQPHEKEWRKCGWSLNYIIFECSRQLWGIFFWVSNVIVCDDTVSWFLFISLLVLFLFVLFRATTKSKCWRLWVSVVYDVCRRKEGQVGGKYPFSSIYGCALEGVLGSGRRGTFQIGPTTTKLPATIAPSASHKFVRKSERMQTNERKTSCSSHVAMIAWIMSSRYNSLRIWELKLCKSLTLMHTPSAWRFSVNSYRISFQCCLSCWKGGRKRRQPKGLCGEKRWENPPFQVRLLDAKTLRHSEFELLLSAAVSRSFLLIANCLPFYCLSLWIIYAFESFGPERFATENFMARLGSAIQDSFAFFSVLTQKLSKNINCNLLGAFSLSRGGHSTKTLVNNDFFRF